MNDLMNCTSNRSGSSESCAQPSPPFLKKQSMGLGRYVIASALIIGFGSCLSVKAFAEEHSHYNSYHGRDRTAPVIQANVNGTQGAGGWYTSDVTINWNISDPESSVTSTSGCNSVTLTSDTSGVTYTCQATSSGGTSSQSVTIKRDATPPKSTIVSPNSGATYTQGQTVQASYSCSDATSGVSSCTGSIANGANLDLSSTGTKSFSVTASDQAGNQTNSSISYTVSASSTGGDTGDSTGGTTGGDTGDSTGGTTGGTTGGSTGGTTGGSTGGTTGGTTSSNPVASAPGTHLFAWNDLGMHCADSDFSVFTLLPPFNDLNAQLVVNNSVVNGSSGYSLTYQSTADPTGSVNSFSVTKTNFWDYALPLFGTNLAPNYGLTGNPAPSFTPAALAWSPDYNWFEATGLPVTAFDDNMNTNYFPMVRVTAYDSTGTAVASTDTVLPISSEINCNTCHASVGGSAAAQPSSGWVNMTSDLEKDWRFNILRLHDDLNSGTAYSNLLTQKGFGNSLESSALAGTPILCDTCHNSNALSVWGINGEKGISNLTTAMHTRHANVRLPGSSQSLDSIGTRDACYNCHPGRSTQCLRGAMGNPVDSAGQHLMECQSCHGSMANVGNAAREGWFDMPKCQSCHHDGKRETVAINADGTFKTWSDDTFASNPDTPGQGWTLYRYSTGHGNLQCEACHNSTHAEYTNVASATNNQVNDNLQAINAQGYAAAIRECTVCHATMPSTTSGGPHGLHPVGQTWVRGHQSASKTNCAYCHGTTSAGSPLAVVKIAKTLNGKTFAANTRITCWSCHNGPNPD